MVPAVRVSIIVPIGPEETEWQPLVKNLLAFEEISEIVLSVTSSFEKTDLKQDSRLKIVRGDTGRAKQLNQGVAEATGKFIWMIHADSSISRETLRQLFTSLLAQPNALYYCDLVFQPGGPHLMWLTQIGVWFRSHLFGLPFGDQGLCLEKEQYLSLGGMNEERDTGEDHDFVWKAKRATLPIAPCGGHITTSARKYRAHGWIKVTMYHFWLTWKEVFRQMGTIRSTLKK